MINETILKIQKTIANSKTISEENRKELLQLVSSLEHEVLDVARSDREEAQSIANFASASAHEAMKEKVDSRMFELAREGLMASVRKFEVTHPDLVSVVNAISTMLANMGI